MKRLLKKANKMQIVYAQEKYPHELTLSKSIFIAGPTPRDESTKSWRPEAIKYLEDIGYDGTVYIPEARDELIDTAVDMYLNN